MRERKHRWRKVLLHFWGIAAQDKVNTAMEVPSLSRFLITGGRLILGEEVAANLSVAVSGKKIEEISPSPREEPGTVKYEVKGAFIAPGFVDLQLNGSGGVLFNHSITKETLRRMHRANLRHGTTSFFPTLITTGEEEMLEAFRVVEKLHREGAGGILGIHLEGPYLNPVRKGIHDEKYIRQATWSMVEAIRHYAHRFPVKLTLAPERVSPEMIRHLLEGGVILSCGHSNATYEEAMNAFGSGIRHVTHLGNAMSPWTSREPGVVGAALDSDEVYCSVIADGIHLHPATLQLFKKLKGEKCYLVSDAVDYPETAPGSFEFGGQTVFVRDGRCVNGEGRLGGALVGMMELVENVTRFIGLNILEAVRMASLYPARVAGTEAHFGRISAGYAANLVIFDQHCKIQAVVDQGEWINLQQ
jgi:N-acetylglucosamine-6-phosphate deacetylase